MAYSFSQLQQATDDWSDANLLGSGGFGAVYKGWDPNHTNTLVAVKRATVQTTKFKEEVRCTDHIMRVFVSFHLTFSSPPQCLQCLKFRHPTCAQHPSHPTYISSH